MNDCCLLPVMALVKLQIAKKWLWLLLWACGNVAHMSGWPDFKMADCSSSNCANLKQSKVKIVHLHFSFFRQPSAVTWYVLRSKKPENSLRMGPLSFVLSITVTSPLQFFCREDWRDRAYWLLDAICQYTHARMTHQPQLRRQYYVTNC